VVAVDLYEFTLQGAEAGTVLRYCTADFPFTLNGELYDNSLGFNRSQIRRQGGLETDTLTVQVSATVNDLVLGVPFHQFLRQGGFDNAWLKLSRAYFNPGQAAYSAVDYTIDLLSADSPVWLFEGQITEVVTGGLLAELRIDSHLFVLDRKMPKNLYQASCGHVVYDPGCGVNRAAFGDAGQVQANSTIRIIQTNLNRPPGWYSLGLLKFTSGALNGFTATIKTHNSDLSLTVIPPLLVVPATGDTCIAFPGCDRTLASCQGKFNNLPRFRGFPWVPAPETAQ
jgi:uncharacterized phage protein (TIGR02218 family)